METALDLDSIREALGPEQAAGPAPKKPLRQPGAIDPAVIGEALRSPPLDLSAIGAALRPTAAAPPLSRFPENQPRYDRFGAPVNEAARDVEAANAPQPTEAEESMSPRTRALGLAVGLGRGVLAGPEMVRGAAGAVFAPPSAEELRSPLLRATMGQYGPPGALQDLDRQAAAPPAGGPSPQAAFFRSLNPLPLLERLSRRDPEAIGEAGGMFLGGRLGAEAMRMPPGTGLVRGGTGIPQAVEAFRTLGLDPRTATEADIQAAWREAAQRTHPDVAPADRAARGGPADPIVAAQEFNAAMQARETALASLGRERPAQGFQAPAAEETQFRARQAEKPAPQPEPVAAAPVVTPPPGRAADALRSMSDEELAAQGPLGSTPPLEASAAAAPGVPPPLPLDVIKRELQRTAPRAVEAPPSAQAPAGEPIAPSPAPEPRQTEIVSPGAPHDQAAVQEGLFGEKTLAGKEQAELLPEAAGQPTAKLKAEKIAPEEVGRVKREGAEPVGERPMELQPTPAVEAPVSRRAAAQVRREEGVAPQFLKPAKKALTPDQQVARHAQLTAQIARDEQVMGAGTHQATFTDVGAHIGQPGQKFVRTRRTGPAYSAAGRLAQARTRLADLEKTMTPEQLARARAAAEPIAAAKAEETSEAAAQGGKTSAQLEREGIEREAQGEGPDYEALAREQASVIPPTLQRTMVDKLIEYGETREDMEKLLPLDLANRALEREVLTPQDETRLLDAIWPSMGAVQARRRGVPIPPAKVPEKSVRDAFRTLLYPEKRGPDATVAARLLRRAIGQMRRDIAVNREKLKDARHQVPSLDTAEGIEWYDRAEGGTAQVAPKLQEANDIVREIYRGLVRDIQALGTGKLEFPIDNYLAHAWQDPEKAKAVYASLRESMARRPFAGSKAFLKERTIPRLVDGLKRGLKPITNNPIDLNLWKMQQMRKYLFAQRFMQDAKAEGLSRFFRVGENLPDGWRRVEDPTFTVYGRTEAGELVMRGHWGMPEVAARIVLNYLSPGLRGNPIADAWLGAANSIVQFKLGASGFHAGFSTYTGAISRLALAVGKLRTGRQPFAAPTTGGTLGGAVGAAVGALGGASGAALGATLGSSAGRLLQKGLALKAAYLDPGAGTALEQKLADLMARSGGQHQMPDEYRTATLDSIKEAARQGKLPKALAHTISLALQTLAWPTMQFYVPLIKMGAFADLAQAELQRLGSLASEADVDRAMQDIWHTIDNRFGQVSYDTRFWNNTIKHVMMGTIQAVGWDVGTVDEHLGGFKDILSGKPSLRFDFFVALPLMVAFLSVMTQLALTGEGPRDLQDLFEPRDGTLDDFGNPNRLTPATYMKDILSFGRHPVATVEHKLNPLIGFFQRLLTNRDFYGNKWRNEQDPITEQLKQAAKFVRDEWTPISVRNVQEQQQRGERGARKFLPLVGITPATREAVRSDAQNMMIDLARSRSPARTPEQQAASTAKRTAALPLSGDQRLVQMFRRLSPDDRQQVYRVATAHERALFTPYLERHMPAYKR